MRSTGKIWEDLLTATIASITAAALAALLHHAFDISRLAALFLAPVVLCGCIRGRRAGIIAALFSVVFYRLFLEYRVAERSGLLEDILNITVFLLVALLTGTLAGRVREEARRAEAHARTMERLFELSRTINGATDEAGLWRLVCGSLAQLERSDSILVVDETGEPRAQLGTVTPEATAAATAALRGSEPPEGQDELWTARAIEDGQGVLGAVSWRKVAQLGADKVKSVDLILQVQAAALARQRAAKLTLRMETAEATAKLREALLSSVSHDFRSPLAAIIGSSSSLLEYGDKFTEEVKRDLVINIQEEAERLNEYVANLLTMARLRAGAIQANLETVSVHDIVEGAKNRLAKHSRTALSLRMNGNYDLIADPLLLEQALYNILDNAMKYGNGGAGIIVSTFIEEGYCRIDIADSGAGIAQDKLDMFFERFSHHRGGSATGTGLGLSIVKGFVEGMGGTVEAKHRSDGEAGLVVSIKMPRLT